MLLHQFDFEVSERTSVIKSIKWKKLANQWIEMKFVALLFAVLCAASFVCAEEEVGEKMSNEEIQELINDYKDLNKNDGPNAPVDLI